MVASLNGSTAHPETENSEEQMSLLQTIQQHLGRSEINQISDQLGVDPQQTEQAVSAAVPMIVGGMAGHAKTSPNGADQIQQAMATHADAADDVPSVIQAPPPSSGLLNRIFGSHQESVQQGVQQASGLALDKVKQLLTMLSPLVLSAFARRGGNQAQQDGGFLSGLLHREAQSAQTEAPHVGGMLGNILGAS
jgi:hypothetical protein